MKESQLNLDEFVTEDKLAQMLTNERKAMSGFLDLVLPPNDPNKNFYYVRYFTLDHSGSGYDCLVSRIDRRSNKLKTRLFFETKVRGRDYPTLLLEKQKFDKLVNLNSTKSECRVFYVNFTPTKTVVFDLLKLQTDNKIQFVTENHNFKTFNKSLGKVPKEIAYLNVNDGKCFEFVYKPE